MSLDIIVRDATPLDWEIIDKFDKTIFSEDRYTENCFKSKLETPDNITKVAEINNEVVGYLNLVINGINGRIARLGVNPSFQRQGIGTNLLNFIISELRKKNGLIELDLLVLKDNYPAIQLYKKLGFSICENYWRHFVLFKSLTH